MEAFLNYVVSKLVEHPEEVRIETLDSPDVTEYRLHLHAADAGRVIGRNGRTISAIRSLANVTSRTGKQIRVELAEESGSSKLTA